MKKIFRLFFVLSVLIVVASCSNRQPKDTPVGDNESTQEKLMKANKYLVNKDADIIRGYIKRRNWDMQISKAGLWYMIYQNGNGAKASLGKTVTFYYKVWLLDGTLCYSSEESGAKRFRLGQGGVESGLEEGMLLLKVGDKARFILPPHLAYGLVGDGNKIPERAIILYEVELIKLEN